LRIPVSLTFALPAIMLFTQSALAQQEERRGFIGLGIGPSAPSGSFAEQLSPEVPNGGVTSGYTDTFVNIAYRLGKRLGVAGAFSYSQYDVPGDENDWWEVSGITVGPMYTLPLGARAAIDVKAMIGTLKVTRVVDNYATDHVEETGVGFEIRGTMRYDLYRRWAVFAEGGLQSTGVTFASGSRGDYRALISGFGVAYRPKW
jgi:hypothetical protein